MRLSSIFLLVLTLASTSVACESAPPRLRLATTTSTRDSGLLDTLLPPFEKSSGVRVDVIAVGTGKALRFGEAGDVDVVLVHARAAEDAFMAAGHGVRREDVMWNTFALLGPRADPAGVKGLEIFAALKQIARRHPPYVSRGDDSGTHKMEAALWRAAGGLEPWDGHVETGQGMGRSLVVASEKQAYILADRGTFLAFEEKIELTPLVVGTGALMNPYGVMVVDPGKHPAVDGARANAFVDYLISPPAQERIRSFRIAGEPLFFPTHLPAKR